MTKNKFGKPPLLPNPKEKKAEDFVNLIDKNEHQGIDTVKREGVKVLYLRVPQSYWDDIQKIAAITGLSANAACLELLRPSIKKKLKELTEEESL